VSQAIWGRRFQAVLLTNRAAARARQHHWVDALGDCHVALRLYPAYLKALKRRGDLYQALGLYTEASNDFEAVRPSVHPRPQRCYESSSLPTRCGPGRLGGRADCVGGRVAQVCTADPRDGQDRSVATAARSSWSAAIRSARLDQPKRLYKILSVSTDASTADIKKVTSTATQCHHFHPLCLPASPPPLSRWIVFGVRSHSAHAPPTGLPQAGSAVSPGQVRRRGRRRRSLQARRRGLHCPEQQLLARNLRPHGAVQRAHLGHGRPPWPPPRLRRVPRGHAQRCRRVVPA
jgi:hypothetical protein